MYNPKLYIFNSNSIFLRILINASIIFIIDIFEFQGDFLSLAYLNNLNFKKMFYLKNQCRIYLNLILLKKQDLKFKHI